MPTITKTQQPAIYRNTQENTMKTRLNRFQSLLFIYLFEGAQELTNEEWQIADARATKAGRIMDKFWPQPEFYNGILRKTRDLSHNTPHSQHEE